jgi:hypothetical protein
LSANNCSAASNNFLFDPDSGMVTARIDGPNQANQTAMSNERFKDPEKHRAPSQKQAPTALRAAGQSPARASVGLIKSHFPQNKNFATHW